MFNLPWQFQYSAGPLITLSLATVILLLPAELQSQLTYTRETIANGELWRLFSANFVHTNTAHFGLNIAGLTLLWLLHGEHLAVSRYSLVLLFCCFGVTVCLFLFAPIWHTYVGLSGALHGVFAYGIVADLKAGIHSGWLLLAGLVAKLGYEFTQGASSDVSELIAASVATESHLFGALIGLTMGFIITARSNQSSS